MAPQAKRNPSRPVDPIPSTPGVATSVTGETLYPSNVPGRPVPGPSGGSGGSSSSGSGSALDRPIPTGESDDKPILDPTGRWELDLNTGKWKPYAGSPIGVSGDFVQVTPPGGNILPTQGVPGGPAAGQVTAQLPQYFEGDEFAIGAGLSPETVAGIQQTLQDAGIISPTATLPFGVWDATTANAMKQVLAVANQQGLDWQTAFDQTTSAAIAMTGGGYLNDEGVPFSEVKDTTPPKLTLPQGYLANPDDLRAITQAVAQRVIGRKVDEQFVNQFVGQFQAAQSANFFNKTWDPESGQWISGAPVGEASPEVAAEKAILGDYGDEAGAYELLNTFDAFEQILAGPFSS